MPKQILAGVLFQADGGPVIAPWLMALIAILLVVLFIWLLRRERSVRDQGPALKMAEDRLAATRRAEGRQSQAWTGGQPGQSGKDQPVVSSSSPTAAAAPEVFVPPMENVAAASQGVVRPVDDLTIIEGIGPKIAMILQNAGVQTFAQLAEMEPERISEILQQGGIRLADTRSWAEQARLAAAGDQAGLKALQDRLKGGRAIS